MAFDGLTGGRLQNEINDNFVISVHALERFEERFPTLWTNDNDVGLFIYQEVIDAIEAGRIASVPPLEFANKDLDRWRPGKSKIVWSSMKTRGYVLIEGYEGMTVATVLVGTPSDEAREKFYKGSKTKRKQSGSSPGQGDGKT